LISALTNLPIKLPRTLHIRKVKEFMVLRGTSASMAPTATTPYRDKKVTMFSTAIMATI